MMTFLSASVTPDAALFALWSVSFWLGVRLLRRGLSLGRVLAFFLAVGAACCVKATSYALIPAAGLVLVVALVRARPFGRSALLALGAAAASLVVTLGVWIVIARTLDRPTSAQLTAAATSSGFDPRFLSSYLWQFYLPRLPFQTPFTSLGTQLPLYGVWIKGAWAAFGWLEVKFPDPVYLGLALITTLVAVAAVVVLWRHRRGSDRAILAFLLVAAATLLAGLHWSEYRALITGAGAFNQGRYLLPLVGIAGLAVAYALRAIPERRRPAGLAVVTGGLVVLQLFSLGLMLERFYA
jgi:predicted branched-subunit amino acid permease